MFSSVSNKGQMASSQLFLYHNDLHNWESLDILYAAHLALHWLPQCVISGIVIHMTQQFFVLQIVLFQTHIKHTLTSYLLTSRQPFMGTTWNDYYVQGNVYRVFSHIARLPETLEHTHSLDEPHIELQFGGSSARLLHSGDIQLLLGGIRL